jgi:hypothetical protein
MFIARPFVHCCPVLALTAQPVSTREPQKKLSSIGAMGAILMTRNDTTAPEGGQPF